MKKLFFLATTTLFLAFILTTASFGQVSLTAINSAVTQNFDGLTTANFNLTDNTSIPGVYAFRAAGNAVPNVFTADNGGSNAGRFNNYGTTAATDRALGSASSGTPGTLQYGVRFANNTGTAITSINVRYTGEQWRNGGNATAQVLAFDYQQAATVTDLTSGTYTAVAALNFTTPTNSAMAAALDGNAAANRTVITQTITVNIPVGQEIMLRWTDINDAGNDHGVSIDDLSVTPQATVSAAGVTIGGRVLTADGRALGKTQITLTDSQGNTRTTVSSSFGFYSFEEVEAGQTYTLNAASKQYQFDAKTISVNDPIADLDFTAQP